MPMHYRHYWGQNTSGIYNLQWDAISGDSFVIITASEGSGAWGSPNRFVGDATFAVHNIAPHFGGVTFRVEIGHYVFFSSGNGPGGSIAFVPWPDPLNLWTDFTVF